MPVTSPFVIVLTAAEETVLSSRVRSGRTEHRDRVRARIVLAAAAGASNAAIAADFGLCVDTARRWRRQFAAHRLVHAGLIAAIGPCAPANTSPLGLPPTVRRSWT